ncbi:programmed cell death protein 1 [Pelodytes ibericus]
MEHLCLIISSICVSFVLGDVPLGDLVFIHRPLDLDLQSGSTAIFTCDIASLPYNPDDINWYKTHNNQSKKIADLKSSSNDRIYITTNWELRKAELHILDVTVNDTGEYHCEHHNITGKNNIRGFSGKSKLNITGVQTTVLTHLTTPRKGTTERTVTVNMIVVFVSVILTVLLLVLLICTAFILTWYKKRNKTPQHEAKQLESPTLDPTVYTVDYGVLEFKNNPYRKSAEMHVTEQIEYATIMFPQGTPGMGERRGVDTL